MSSTWVTDAAGDRVAALHVAGLVPLPDRGPRLYARRAGDAFSRDASAQGAVVLMDDAAAVDFALPAGAIDYLRFELPAVPGCYRMGPVVIDGRTVEDLSRRVMLVNGQRLQDPDAASEIRVANWSAAPSFELDVRDLLGSTGRTGPTAIRVTVRKEHAAIELNRRLDAAVADVARQLDEHGRAMRGAMEEVAAAMSLAQLAAHDRLQAGVAELHARVNDALADVSKVHQRIDRLDADVGQSLATQTGALRQDSGALRQELAALRQQLDALHGQIDFLTQYELNRSLVRRAWRKVKRVFGK